MCSCIVCSCIAYFPQPCVLSTSTYSLSHTRDASLSPPILYVLHYSLHLLAPPTSNFSLIRFTTSRMYADPQSDPYAPLTEEQKEMAAGDKRVIIGTVIGTLGVVSVLFLYVLYHYLVFFLTLRCSSYPV